jgi:hypothetical protein
MPGISAVEADDSASPDGETQVTGTVFLTQAEVAP